MRSLVSSVTHIIYWISSASVISHNWLKSTKITTQNYLSLTYIIKVAIDTLRSSFMQTLHDWHSLVIDCKVEAQLVGEPFAFLVGAAYTDDGEAHIFPNLAHMRANCSGSTTDNECFSGFWFA